jgi:hypothetical protein
LRIEADDKAFLLLLVPTVAIDLELNVSNPVPEADQGVPVLGAVDLGQQVNDLGKMQKV